MLNCPFCGFDYTDEGLREGRCPSCGGVLAWDDSVHTMARGDYIEPASDVEDHPAPEPLAAPSDSSISDDVPLGDGNAPQRNDSAEDPAIRVKSSADTTTDKVGEEDSGHSTAPDISAPMRPRDLSDRQQRHVTAMWAGALAGNETPGMTIKSSAALADVASQLVVRPRTLVRRGDGHTGPADYELLKTIGEGGVGIVYSARQASIDRTVAVKMLKPGMDGADDREKFLSEAVVTGDLDHPNIVPIHDLGSDKHGALFYSMKQVHGTPWLKVLQEKTQFENLEILMKVCDAIAFAHARGVIHRDIKPDNVMLGDFGEVMVMDWGIALSMSLMKKAGAGSKVTAMGGTPAYMAPEMATGPVDSIGRASDIYLLGAVLFEIITGEPPHHGVDVRACLLAAARNEIRSTEQSGELLDIAFRALSTKLQDRYASVQDLQSAVREYQSHSESINLAIRAEEELGEAQRSNDYQDFSHAQFAFEEALSLWDHNSKAREGVARAKLAYATSAHEKGDYDLGLSLLDKDTPEHAHLCKKLETAVRERDTRQQRLRSMKRIAGLLLVTVLGGGAVAFCAILILYFAAESAKVDAENAKVVAEGAKENAVAAKDEAVAAKDEADKARQSAEEQRTLAESERERAEDERRTAVRSMRREAESSYKSEILLAGENIANHDFSGARNLLLGHKDSSKRKLRHWEWGRLWHRCRLDQLTLDTQKHEFAPRGGPVGTVALSPDDRLIAVGTSGGWIYVWSKPLAAGWASGTAKAAFAFDIESPVYSLAFSHDGTRLAIGGGTDRKAAVTIWELDPEEEEPVLKKDVSDQCGHLGRVTCLSFSADDKLLLTGSEDRTARLTTWQSEAPSRAFRGHFDTVWSVEFSNDANQSWIVSASEDGTVRIWDPETGVTVQRFQEHKGPVYSAVFSPDDRYVASGGYDKRVLVCKTELVEFELARKRGEDLGERAQTMFVSEVEARLADGSPPTPPLREFGGHQASVRAVRFSQFGSLLISGSQDHTLNVWDTRLTSEAAASDPSGAGRERNFLEHLRMHRDEQTETESLLMTLQGHGGWVHSCALSTDGKTLLSGSYDMTAKLWNLADYRELDVFRSHLDRPALSAAISPDGRYVAAAYDDGTATFWDLHGKTEFQIPPSGDKPKLVEGHDYLASRAVFSRDGSLLFTAAGDKTVRIWDAHQGTQTARIPARTGHRGILAISPDGRWILTGSDGKKAVLWKLDSQWTPQKHVDLDHAERIRQRLFQEFPNGDKNELEKRVPIATAACISPDAKLAFTGDADGGCWLWELDSGQLRHQLAGQSKQINAAQFTPDGRYVLTAGADNTVTPWDVDTGREALVRLPHRGSVTGLDIIATEDDTYVLTTSAVPSTTATSGSNEQSAIPVYRWRLGSDEPQEAIDIQAKRINSVAFSPDGRSALVSASNNRLFSWDFDRNAVEPVWSDKTPRGAINGAVFSPEKDEARILTIGGDGASLWDRASGHKVMTYRPHDAVGSVSFSADGKYVVTASIDGSAKIWSYQDGVVRAIWKLEGSTDDENSFQGHVGPLNRAVFHPRPGTMTILTAGADGIAKLWNLFPIDNTWRVTHTYSNSGDTKATVRQAAFSPDGRRVLTTSDDGLGRIWDVDDPRQDPLLLQGHTQPVLCGTFSPDGHWVMTGGEDRTVIFFDAVTGSERTRITGFSAPVSTVAFSPDGQRILVGEDKSVELWDAKPLCRSTASGADAERSGDEPGVLKEILTLEAHQRGVTSAAFSFDGRDVITSSRDGTMILWKGELVEASIELSLDVIDYRTQSQVTAVDPYALVRDPSSVDFEGGVLEIRLTTVSEANETAEDGANARHLAETERLHVSSGGVDGNGDPRIAIKKDHDVYFDDVMIATYGTPLRDETSLTLTLDLTGEASGLSIEALLRSITYRNDALGELDEERFVSVGLRDGLGRAGNYEKSAEEKTIRVRAAVEPPEALETAFSP